MSAASSLGLIAQIPITDDWGTDEEYELKSDLAQAFQERIEEAGLGRFDGTDIGSGNVNFFFYEFTAATWDPAVAVVLDEFRRRGLDEKAVLVRSMHAEEGEQEPDDPWTVIWPPDYQGTFRLF